MANPNQSGTVPIFEQNAEDLVRRLEAEGTPKAHDMAHEARMLALVFREWRSVRPADDDRVETIKRLFDLTRRAMDHLALGRTAGTKPPA
jgi:hypothetical protein